MDGLVSDLQALIKQPSVSAKKTGLVECANLVASMMQRSGINSEVLYLDDKTIPPIVYGEVRSRANPTKTLLFYNHYDVQPEDPVELWDDDPFSGKVDGNKIFGRGSADDKGELITRIKAVEYCLKSTGDVPCNVKFMVEGEEEIGSVHVEQYLEKYKEKLACDGVIWEFGYVDAKERPVISLGMKGLLYVELLASGPVRDAHSSLAVLIENPAWRLVQALSTMRDKNGRVLIKDWYREARPFTKQELAAIAKEPFDVQEFKQEYGVKKFVNNAKGTGVKKALVGMPTCNIAGFDSGYIGEGAKTVLPAKARVKIDFRLIPGMVPEKQLARLKKHLKDKGFSDIEVRFIHGEAAARTPLSDPFVKMVQEAAEESFGSSVTSVSSAGTGPMYSFVKVLQAPCISVGSTYLFARIHSPNEFARIDLLNKCTKCMARILEKFSA
ncbi:M20/M25/M40 family metallo-hydrolase [Nitrososphaera sp.]|uniref:M20/M25/M40 family metallo-hydrolase n=1 Tax=Nitrososphaera sp. TaxID=1971748 RepID=UPI0017F842E8|nr:M20/M25/M40 family metallo-hydrolase [Nitrososphaera sp.]